jgi:hypothetical protein
MLQLPHGLTAVEGMLERGVSFEQFRERRLATDRLHRLGANPSHGEVRGMAMWHLITDYSWASIAALSMTDQTCSIP